MLFLFVFLKYVGVFMKNSQNIPKNLMVKRKHGDGEIKNFNGGFGVSNTEMIKAEIDNYLAQK